MAKHINNIAIRMVKASKEILVLQHADNESPGMLADFFNDKGWTVRTIHMGQMKLKPFDMLNAALIIAMGGPMNVYETEKYPFLKNEEELLHNAMTRKIPVLGICLGAQILAKACGAKVGKAPAKELGWYNVALTETGLHDPLFAGIARQFTVFQWHEDTFDLPVSVQLLASGDKCVNQAFRCGPNAYGLQFHVEASLAMVKEWLRDPIARGDKEFNYEMIVKAGEEYDGDVRIQAFDICRNLEKIIIEAHA
jgi:GMP synthase (glutamine-hydrolysing)